MRYFISVTQKRDRTLTLCVPAPMLHRAGAELTMQFQEFSIHTAWKISYKDLQNKPFASRSGLPRRAYRKKMSYKHWTNFALGRSVFTVLHRVVLRCRWKRVSIGSQHPNNTGSFILQINSWWELFKVQIWELSSLFMNWSILLFNSILHASFWNVSDEAAVFRSSKMKLYPHFGPVY